MTAVPLHQCLQRTVKDEQKQISISNQYKTRYGVCPYTDQCVNLSFDMRIEVKWILCYFLIVSRPVAYVQYSKT